MPRLEYTGGVNPHRDLPSFVKKVKTQFPTISERGISQLAKKALDLYDARTGVRSVSVYGEDILTEHPETIPAWPFLEDHEQRRILAHPIASGERLGAGTDKISRLEMANRLDHGSIHRSALVSLAGLEQTYVWRMRTLWVQEVTPNDYALLLAHPQMRRKLQDPDIHGPVLDVRAYDWHVTDRHIAHDMADVRALQRHFSRTPQFAGSDIRKD